MQSIITALYKRATETPSKVAFSFIKDEGGISSCEEITYQQVLSKSYGIAQKLMHLTDASETVVLLFPPGLDYICGFFGCMLAGKISVPAYPPRNNRHMERIDGIVQDANSNVILSDKKTRDSFISSLAKWGGSANLNWLDCDTTDNVGADSLNLTQSDFSALSINPIAFLQYTSGSTSAPKGVVLTHQNLLTNLDLMKSAFCADSDSVGASWLPPYHDMGLIGGILLPMYCGFNVFLMSPASFVQTPFKWLKIISDHGVTISPSPNFGYDQCTSKISSDLLANLDLSTWKYAITGAELIRGETVDRFSEKFGSCGFDRRSFYPCYGLAEGTLIVTGKSLANLDLQMEPACQTKGVIDNARYVAGCGYALGKGKVIVAQIENDRLVKGTEIGEICIKGPSVSSGYWKNPIQTAKTFDQKINGESGYCRTGDLGFFKNEELFITGRIKELMIVRGKNFYPQDIEHKVEACHPNIVRNTCAAFSMDINGAEELCVVQEVEKTEDIDYAAIAKEIRSGISKNLEITPARLCLIKKGTISKTSSGKIQRWVVRQQLEENNLHLLHEDNLISIKPNNLGNQTLGAFSTIEDTVLFVYRKIFHDDAIALADDFFELGGDSLICLEIASGLNDHGIQIGYEEIYEHPCIGELCKKLQSPSLARSDVSNLQIGAAQEKPSYALSPQQKRYWDDYLLKIPGRSWSNIFKEMDLNNHFFPTHFTTAMEKMIEKHESLRIGFVEFDNEIRQTLNQDVPFNLEVIDLSNLTQEKREYRLKKLQFENAKHVFDLRTPPLFKITAIKFSDTNWKLQFVFHHIIADAYSLQLLERETFKIYSTIVQGQIASVEKASRSYIDFSEWMNIHYSTSNKKTSDRAFWRQELKDLAVDEFLPIEFPDKRNSEDKSGRAIQIAIPNEIVCRAKEFSRSNGVSLFSLVLSIFNIELATRLNTRDVVIGSPAVGRESESLTEIIGLFINLVMIRTKFDTSITFEEFSKKIQKKILTVLSHQAYQLDEIARDLNISVKEERFPFTTVFLSSLKFDAPVPAWTDTADHIAFDLPTDVRFEMMTYLLEHSDGLILDCKFRKALFPDKLVKDILENVVHKLDYFSQHPSDIIFKTN
jgi:acyl-CoA synthetase (AMP-forming)/AMP-acid ligase II/aryl carrier-like protein